MENQAPQTATNYRVLDEMSCEVLLETTNLGEATDKAWNHQCVLINADSNTVIKDYSCDF